MELNYEKNSESLEIPFQKPGGPYHVEATHYETVNESYDYDTFAIYKNDQLKYGFRFSALNENGPNKIYEDIAKDLKENYPTYFDSESYYSTNIDFLKKIPIKDFHDAIQQNIRLARDVLIEHEQDVKKIDPTFLHAQNHGYEEIKERIKSQLLSKEYAELNKLKYQYYDKDNMYSQSKEQFDSKEKPSWLHFKERLAYNNEKSALKQQKSSLNQLQVKIREFENRIKTQLESQHKLINNMTVSLYEYQKCKHNLQAVSRLSRQLSSITDNQRTITIKGNYRDIGNIINQSESISKQSSQLIKLQKKELSQSKSLENQHKKQPARELSFNLQR